MSNDSSDRAREIAECLSPHEADLLLGRCEGWGSWMFTAAGHMASLGLGRKVDGNIYLDTPLADAVRAHLEKSSD